MQQSNNVPKTPKKTLGGLVRRADRNAIEAAEAKSAFAAMLEINEQIKKFPPSHNEVMKLTPKLLDAIVSVLAEMRVKGEAAE
jgi:hypothetical protein